MRKVNGPSCFTPFGLWMREFLRDSNNCEGGGLTATNIDYVLHDYQNKKIMILEEKTKGGIIHYAQSETFKILDKILYKYAKKFNLDYWGFYVLQFPPGKELPCAGMRLNWNEITTEQLIKHMNFEEKFNDSLYIMYPR